MPVQGVTALSGEGVTAGRATDCPEALTTWQGPAQGGKGLVLRVGMSALSLTAGSLAGKIHASGLHGEADRHQWGHACYPCGLDGGGAGERAQLSAELSFFPHAAFGTCDLSVLAEAPASIPSAELILPLCGLGMSLHPSL